MPSLAAPWNLSRQRSFDRLRQEAQFAAADAVIGIEMRTKSFLGSPATSSTSSSAPLFADTAVVRERSRRAAQARDEELARAGQWLTVVLEAISPAADRRLVQAYATWQVMRRLRASAAAAARPRTPTAHARNNIRAAASLLAWLRGRGTGLAACGQADIDQWLHTGPSACLARDFLAWAARAATARS